MYLPAVILAVALACGQALMPNSVDQDEVQMYLEERQGGELVSFLEKFKNTMVHGDAAIHVPVLDPFQRAEMDIDNKELIVLKGKLQNVRVVNLSKYRVNKADFSSKTLTAAVNLQWDDISIASNYDLVGKTPNNINFKGKGTVGIVIKNARVSVNTKLMEKNGKMAVASLSMNVHLDKFYFKITGFQGSKFLSDQASRIVTNMAPKWIEDNQKEVARIGGQYVTKELNKYLSHFTLEQFLNMINN